MPPTVHPSSSHKAEALPPLNPTICQPLMGVKSMQKSSHSPPSRPHFSGGSCQAPAARVPYAMSACVVTSGLGGKRLTAGSEWLLARAARQDEIWIICLRGNFHTEETARGWPETPAPPLAWLQAVPTGQELGRRLQAVLNTSAPRFFIFTLVVSPNPERMWDPQAGRSRQEGVLHPLALDPHLGCQR